MKIFKYHSKLVREIADLRKQNASLKKDMHCIVDLLKDGYGTPSLHDIFIEKMSKSTVIERKLEILKAKYKG